MFSLLRALTETGTANAMADLETTEKVLSKTFEQDDLLKEKELTELLAALRAADARDRCGAGEPVPGGWRRIVDVGCGGHCRLDLSP